MWPERNSHEIISGIKNLWVYFMSICQKIKSVVIFTEYLTLWSEIYVVVLFALMQVENIIHDQTLKRIQVASVI